MSLITKLGQTAVLLFLPAFMTHYERALLIVAKDEKKNSENHMAWFVAKRHHNISVENFFSGNKYCGQIDVIFVVASWASILFDHLRQRSNARCCSRWSNEPVAAEKRWESRKKCPKPTRRVRWKVKNCRVRNRLRPRARRPMGLLPITASLPNRRNRRLEFCKYFLPVFQCNGQGW